MPRAETRRLIDTCNRLNPSWQHLRTMWKRCRRWLKSSNPHSMLQDMHSLWRFLQANKHSLPKSRWAQSLSEESLNLHQFRPNQNLKSSQNQNQHQRLRLRNLKLNQYLCQRNPFLFQLSIRSHYQVKRNQLKKPDSRTKSRLTMRLRMPLQVHLVPNLYQNPR